MKLQKHFIFLLLCMAALGCNKPACFDEGGPVSKSARTAIAIKKIELYDNINLVLTQDSVERITIEAPRFLTPNISTAIDQQVLTIRNNVDCNWLRNPDEIITVYVSVKSLEEITYNGSGHITSTNTLTSDRLFFYSYEGAGNINVSMQADVGGAYIHQENADIILSGTCNRFFSYTNARGTIDFKNLLVQNMVIEYGGVRDAAIHVTNELDAIIYHTGNLYYRGTPTIKKVTHSSGQLLRLP